MPKVREIYYRLIGKPTINSSRNYRNGLENDKTFIYLISQYKQHVTMAFTVYVQTTYLKKAVH